MLENLLNPDDPPEVQHARLSRIVSSLVARVEKTSDESGAAYAQFQRAAVLEEQVRQRTEELEDALALVHNTNLRLSQAKAEAENTRAYLSNAIEAVREGFALFDQDDRLVLFNSRFCAQMPDIQMNLKSQLHFNDFIALVSQSNFVTLSKDENPQGWFEKRLKIHHQGRGIFNLPLTFDRWLQVSEQRTPEGGTVILHTEITDIIRKERQERERLLDDQDKIIRATLEHLNQGICIFDHTARLIGWNRLLTELLPIQKNMVSSGSDFGTLLDQVASRIWFGSGMSLVFLKSWGDGQVERAPLHFEIERYDNMILDVFAQSMPGGGFVISFSDVTAEKTAVRSIKVANETLEQRVKERTLDLEAALNSAERANASKSRFVAAASHDLLQPLSAAKLYMASLEIDIPQEARDVVRKASRALKNIEDILAALLDISKLDLGRAMFDITAVHLNTLFEQIRDEVQPLARQKNLELRIVPSDVTVQSDATYLKRILQNLVGNALKYTETGKVLLGVRHVSKSSIRIEVWDTGPGIPPDKLDIIFAEFQRLSTTKRPAEGMGLGLAIVERACGLLNHPLSVKSEPGKGTGFLVQMDKLCSKLTPLETAVEGLRNGADHHLGNLVVLLIENDRDLQNALAMTMESWGLGVLTAYSSDEALDLLCEIDMSPDIVLADYHLDGEILGSEAISLIFQQYGALPAALITADRSANLARKCVEQKITLLHKPLGAENLRQFLIKVSGRTIRQSSNVSENIRTV